MIQIHFKNPKIKTVEKLYYQLGLTKKGKGKQDELRQRPNAVNSWCKANLIMDGKAYSFPEIIKADFNVLTKIKQKIDDKKIVMPDDLKKYMINTLYEKRFPRKDFVDALEVTVCPYCNRNFVNSALDKTMCDLDHFYEKSEYPILAISFYNLVPVCHYCNHTKSTNKIAVSSHDSRFKTDELLTFDFHIRGIDFLNDKQQLGVEIYDAKEISSNIDILKLRELYQIHTDVVQEYIKKVMVFEPGYLNYLANEYKDLFISKEELYRIVFGNYYEEETYGKRPLSKMVSDILVDLLMLYYSIDLKNTSNE